jgi:hypothetical protein
VRNQRHCFENLQQVSCIIGDALLQGAVLLPQRLDLAFAAYFIYKGQRLRRGRLTTAQASITA